MDLKPKVLSVDDSSTVRKVIKSTVEGLKYTVLEASDASEALVVLSKEYENVRLILLDWNMPGMSGLEFLKTIKQINLYRNIPVIMVTTEGEKDQIVKAVQAGVANYLLKPFTSDELAKKVLQCIGRAQ